MTNDLTLVTFRARGTGNKKVNYRWVCAVDGDTLIPAKEHPAAVVIADTWSDQIDGRVTRRTLVHLPVGLLVIDVERATTGRGAYTTTGEPSYTAAILREGKDPLDWSAARHVRFAREDLMLDAEDAPMAPGAKRGRVTVSVHYVEIAGVVRRYVQRSSHE